MLLVNGEVPIDYKFFCFNGAPKMVQVDYGRHSEHRRNLYDLDWKLIDGRYVYQNKKEVDDKPKNFDTMCRIAQALSSEMDFVRVDLYNVDGKIYFGELTHFPEGGFGRFLPESLDRLLGTFWTVPDAYTPRQQD